MPVSERLRELVVQHESGNTTVAWPATRLLGLLAKRHFLAVVEALQRHGECDELRALEESFTALQSESGVVEHEG